MFLDLILRRNPTLVEQAIALHQAGLVPANSYVIDLDAVTRNAAVIAAALGFRAFRDAVFAVPEPYASMGAWRN